MPCCRCKQRQKHVVQHSCTVEVEDDFGAEPDDPAAPYPTPSKQSSTACQGLCQSDGDKDGFGSTRGVLSSAARWIAVYEGLLTQFLIAKSLFVKLSAEWFYGVTLSENFRAAADTDFNELLIEAETAIENEVLPQRIHKGSSGSYFVKDSNHVSENQQKVRCNCHATIYDNPCSYQFMFSQDIIGVFKPRDEEPYGSMNPKWAKWFQRHCCCCCFGRGCIVPNTGYLSEAGASLVDIRLGLNIVPRTKVIRMASTTFHYGNMKRKAAKAKQTLADKFPAVGRRFHRIGLPLKVKPQLQAFVVI